MVAPTSTRRLRSRAYARTQTDSEAHSTVIGAAVAMMGFAAILGGLAFFVEAAWMRIALPVCALVCVACGSGLLRASERARMASVVTCFAITIGAVLFFRSWTTTFSIGALGAFLALPSTKSAFDRIRARQDARLEKR